MEAYEAQKMVYVIGMAIGVIVEVDPETGIMLVKVKLSNSVYTKLRDLPEGAIFETKDGTKAVKSEYCYDSDWPHSKETQCICVLLASGKYAHFPNKNDELVREITI